ncbi:MAG: coproporphyrinogen III oxidase family protein [Treponema sp.]|jgi:oxygen-independent coproporphyrinogen-3 oxidase|nr:coproporphyrinogen III oxidase family protein [Treponema sp.]
MTSSLYLHVPFCASACDYCDFFSVPLNAVRDDNLPDLFIDAALGDVKDQLALFNVDHVPAVYIGGGTPSVLGASRASRLLGGLQALLQAMKKPPLEITIEANPESAGRDFLQACADGGVSRISLGVQTFHEAPRRAVRRSGGALLEERLALASEYFPGAFSADLITGLPFQTGGIVLNDIEKLLAFKPAHVSLYSLILEPETPLGEQESRQGAAAISLPCGDEADKLWMIGRGKLEKAGFAQYEVSNFSLPDKTCAHNIRYWRMENWLGAGPSASGTIIEESGSGKRRSYPADIGAYLAAPRVRSAHVEELDRAALIRESLLMGFRYSGGPDPLLFRRRFGLGIEDCIPQTLARWRGRGFFENGQPGGFEVSRNGMLFLNGFLRDAFVELDGQCQQLKPSLNNHIRKTG